MNSLEYAERELALIGMGADTKDEMNKAMHDHIILMVKTFADEGHSGMSAAYALSILKKLLAFEPLTPLTGEDSEWIDRSDISGKPHWQNNRCSRVFKDEDGSCYDINGRVFREPNGSCYTSRDSRVNVTFPYTPKTEYVDVLGEEIPA